ncbi:hypothetical protein [Azospirillum endophyticum]
MQIMEVLRTNRAASLYRSLLLFFFLGCLLFCYPSHAQTACERDHPRRPDDPPTDVSYGVGRGAFVSRLIADLVNPAVEGDQVFADFSLSFTVEASHCPRPISFPLGLTFRHARFLLSNPVAVSVPTSMGIANVVFDPDRLSATLVSVLPPPPFLQYRVSLKTASANVTGTTIDVELIAPDSLGIVARGEWILDQFAPDFGLRGLAEQLSGQRLSFARDSAAVKAEFVAQTKRVFEGWIAHQTIDIGHAKISGLSLDWDRWGRGDKVLSGDLTWPGTTPELAAVLPASTELRFSDGLPRLSPAPLDLNKLKKLIADQVAERVAHPERLVEMVRRFGNETARDLPLGWLKIRNANVTPTLLSAEFGFAIGDEDPIWRSATADLPLTSAAFSQIVAKLAQAAEKSIASYVANKATNEAYEQVLKFLDHHKADKFPVFGLSVTLTPVVPKDGILPPKPIVQLSAAASRVTITNVGITVDGDKPIFDWTAATVEGMPALQAAILKESGLADTDFGFQIKSLSFSGGAFTGQITGSLLDIPFEAPFAISEGQKTLALPNANQIIVPALRKAVAGKSLSISGLTLSDIDFCPGGCDGNRISARARVKVAEYFEGSVTLGVSPKISLENLALAAGPALTAFTSLPTGLVTINPPTQFNPLVVDGVIKISQLFGAIPVPDIPFRYLARTGKLEIAFPTVIAIDTDVPIPPWLNLSQVRIPVGKSASGIIEIGVRMTLGQHYVQYIFNVDGTLRANPKERKVDLSGEAALLTVKLFSANGTVDFSEKRMRFDAQTRGELAKILTLNSEMTVDGQACMASQQQKVKFLFLGIDGSLIIQVPPDLCGSSLPRAAAGCGIGGSGGVCVSGQASAGALGNNAEATLSGNFDLKFNLILKTSVAGVADLKIEGNENRLGVSGRILNKIKFSFPVPHPNANSDKVIKEIIDQLLNFDLKDLKLPRKIELSVGGGNVKVDVADDNSTVEDDGGSESAPPARNGQPRADGTPASQGTAGTLNAQPPLGKDKGQTLGDGAKRQPVPEVSNIGKKGPIRITFDEQRRLVATNTETGVVTRSADPVDLANVELSKTACFGWVTWVTANPLTNAAPEASLADGWIFGMQSGCAPPTPITCPAGTMCAVGLRNGGAGSGPLDLGALKWPSAARILSRPDLANDLEYGLMRAKARARLFPQKSLVRVDGEWRCAVPDRDSCKAAVEWIDSVPVAFVSAIGSTFALADGSLLKWAAIQSDKTLAQFFGETDTSDLRVLGQAAEGWLIRRTQMQDKRVVTLLSFVRSDGSTVPVEADNALHPPGQNPWEVGKTNRLLDQAAQMIGRSKTDGTWHIDDPGKTMGGSRLLLVSDTDIILLSAPESAGTDDPNICRRETTVAKASPHSTMSAAHGSTLTAKLHDLITMEPDAWRERGLRVNPVLSLFGNSCQ